jgi:UDP-glucose 4-epimerase
MKKNTKIVITGSSGFVGSHLLNKLKDMPISVTCFDRSQHSFFDLETLDSLLYDADIIFHFAATSAGSGYNPSPVDIYKNNVEATYNLIASIRKYCRNQPIVVLLSSIHVYHQSGSKLTEESVLGPSSVYGMSKLVQEKILLQAGDEGLINPVIFRASNIYGPGSRANYNSAISTFCERVNKGKEIVLFSNGQSLMDLIYINDVVSYLLQVDILQSGKVYNMASGFSVSVGEIINMISKISEKKVRIKKIDSPLIKFSIDNKKLRESFPEILFTSIEDGLKSTCMVEE